MIADEFELRLGKTTVKGRCLTYREIKANWEKLMMDRLDIPTSIELIRSHVTLADGTPLEPEDLSPNQIREIVIEMAMPRESRGIADFIGLLV